ncbi:MAG TPA: SURF1 family protein [Egibacteraceae bacterium]|nr:SURF1 family protein [Egibacteraceae bacterium]
MRDNGRHMYRFLLSPKWLFGHGLVAVAVLGFVSLGFWQLDRHEQRSARNALVAERMQAPPADLAAVADKAGEDLAYRRVRLSGRYLPAGEVLLTPRSWNGQPGHHVLTPLATDDGWAVLVARGWVPFALDSPPVAEAAPPRGQVRVSGLVFPDEPATRFAPAIPSEGELIRVSRVDVERLQRQIDVPLRPYYVQLAEQTPATVGELPRSADPPELTAGNHLSYAVQWFLFAAVVALGYPALIRRTALDEVRERPGDGISPVPIEAGNPSKG